MFDRKSYMVNYNKKNHQEHKEARNAYCREYYHKNKEKRDAYRKKWNEENFHHSREWRMRRLYGIGLKDYDILYEKQLGLCPICSLPLPEDYKACVDHNHKTNEVRGLLHQECNRAIGALKEDPNILRRAAVYLEN